MFFKVKKPEPTRAAALAELRTALRDAAELALERHVHPRDVERAFDDVSENIRMKIACTTPCPEAATAGLYDVERLTIQDQQPRLAPTPRPVPLRYPRSTDAADMAAYLDSVTQPMGQR